MRTPHYQFFPALEQEFEESIRFVELDSRNFDTFSTAYLKMLFAACIEIEAVHKEISKRNSARPSPRNIDEIRPSILGVYQSFHMIEVSIPRYSMKFQPWASWGSGSNPTWWHAYTATKHSRATSYHQANRKNVLEALAALFAGLLYLYAGDNPRIELEVEPRLFHYENLFPQAFVYGEDITLP